MPQDFLFKQTLVNFYLKSTGKNYDPLSSINEMNKFVNVPESKSFLGTALAWQGSVTPKVLPRVIFSALYALAIYYIEPLFPGLSLWDCFSFDPCS
jgi:hypothetical protein